MERANGFSCIMVDDSFATISGIFKKANFLLGDSLTSGILYSPGFHGGINRIYAFNWHKVEILSTLG